MVDRAAGGPLTASSGRRAILAAGLAAALPVAARGAEPDGLAALAAARGLSLGAMVCEYQLRETPALWPLVAREAAFVVPGLELKWGAVQPGPGRFDFAPADALAARAKAAGLGLRGHALVWGEALPPWFDRNAGAAAMRRTLEAHIAAVAGHYAGRMQSWDVVNEPIAVQDRRPDGLQATPFLRALGPDYIPLALRWAAEADPAAKLVINEYDLEFPSRWQQDRRRATLELLNRLVRQGAPLHALGIQAHLWPGRERFEPEVLRRFIRDVASLGLEVYVTELDIVDRELPAALVPRDAATTALLRDYLAVVLSEPAVTLLALWGLTDKYEWASGNAHARRRDGQPSRAHPFDTELRPKPDRAVIAAALRDVPRPRRAAP